LPIDVNTKQRRRRALDDQHDRGGASDPDGDTPQEPSVTLVGGR